MYICPWSPTLWQWMINIYIYIYRKPIPQRDVIHICALFLVRSTILYMWEDIDELSASKLSGMYSFLQCRFGTAPSLQLSEQWSSRGFRLQTFSFISFRDLFSPICAWVSSGRVKADLETRCLTFLEAFGVFGQLDATKMILKRHFQAFPFDRCRWCKYPSVINKSHGCPWFPQEGGRSAWIWSSSTWSW